MCAFACVCVSVFIFASARASAKERDRNAARAERVQRDSDTSPDGRTERESPNGVSVCDAEDREAWSGAVTMKGDREPDTEGDREGGERCVLLCV